MSLALNAQVLPDYLFNRGLCDLSDRESLQIEIKPAKNFNLQVKLPRNRALLVKQERLDAEGKSANEFFNEWQFSRLLTIFPELRSLMPATVDVLHFDAENSIIVYRYLDDYLDLDVFYQKQKVFPVAIATALGFQLAELHRATFKASAYRDFIDQVPDGTWRSHLSQFTSIQRLERLSPDIFGAIPNNCLKFFVLYQRYESLEKAICTLLSQVRNCCVTHNDLKLNNILVYVEWEQQRTEMGLKPGAIRLIDWERYGWGDPAFDVGTVIAGYLQIWLNSLVIDSTMSLEASLQIAGTPLERLQPSLIALIQAYLNGFSDILEDDPQFVSRVTQYVGLALIQQIIGTMQHQKYFGNASICLLQVAKSLLCRPLHSFITIFGKDISELLQDVNSVAKASPA